jgi:hypothetical protein
MGMKLMPSFVKIRMFALQLLDGWIHMDIAT